MVLVLNWLLFYFVPFHFIISFSEFNSFQVWKHLNYKHKCLVWKTTWNIKGKTKSNKLFFSQRITAMSYNNDKVIIIIVIVSYGWSSNWLVLFGFCLVLFGFIWIPFGFYLNSVFSLIFPFCFQFHTPILVYVCVCLFFFRLENAWNSMISKLEKIQKFKRNMNESMNLYLTNLFID